MEPSSGSRSAGPTRRVRSTRAARNNAVQKTYRDCAVQTGMEPHDIQTQYKPSTIILSHPMIQPTYPHPTLESVQHLAFSNMEHTFPTADPPGIPSESCKRMREHGVDPNWIVKPPLGQPCHWRPTSCSTVRVDWRPGDWERHLQTHLPDSLKAFWACPGCSKTFNRKDSFKRHLKRPETACSARVDVVNSNEWEVIFYHEPLPLS